MFAARLLSTQLLVVFLIVLTSNATGSEEAKYSRCMFDVCLMSDTAPEKGLHAARHGSIHPASLPSL